jgi:hypothetical protein
MPDIYQLKVTLLGTDPPIWRRLLVPADLVLAKLHDILQIAMGWDSSHLYEFNVGKQIYGRPNPEERYFSFSLPTINDRKVRLEEVLPRVRSKLVYTYDMGDSWEHSVVVEKRLPADPDVAYPVCNRRRARLPAGGLRRRRRVLPRAGGYPKSRGCRSQGTAGVGRGRIRSGGLLCRGCQSRAAAKAPEEVTSGSL